MALQFGRGGAFSLRGRRLAFGGGAMRPDPFADHPSASLVIEGDARLFGARPAVWLAFPTASLAIDGDARLFGARDAQEIPS
ncbi:hypothetical protein [Salinarimonas sp.]|uniref:hypothetical protein n=1 Tax=Salinarimonas sp. TaxID=2766526 RepID=UPI0039196BF8